MKTPILLALVLLGPAAMAQSPAPPLCPVEDSKVLAGDAAFDAGFGFRVAVSGDWAVVSSPFKAATGNGRGAAYVYHRSGRTWTQTQKLSSNLNDTQASFGYSVAIDGDTIAVGDHFDDFVQFSGGAVFIYERNGTDWNQTDKIAATDIANPDHFGQAVELDGDQLIVGAPSKLVNGFTGSGAAYVFERNGTDWNQTVRLPYSDPETFLRFGTSVAIDGDVAVVGATGEDQIASSAGTAYVYNRIGTIWQLRQKIFGNDIGFSDFFGQEVDVSGTTILVGAQNNGSSGAAYVFEREPINSSWPQQAKLTSPNAANGSQFGISVALEGDRAVVGDYFEAMTFSGGSPFQGSGAPPTGGEGSAYVFERSGTVWTEMAQIIPRDHEPQDNIGIDVALDGGMLLVGSWQDDDVVTDAGSAYFYSLERSQPTYCTGKTSSLGCVPWLSTCGTPSVSDTGAFRIFANDMIPGEAGLLIYSLGASSLDFHGGKLCIEAPFITRFPPRVAKSFGAPPCSGVLRRNFQKRIQSGIDPMLTVGAQVNAQWQQRDLADPAGFGDSLTNAVEFFIQP